MRVELIKVEDIHPDPSNPRSDDGDIQAIVDTLDEWGMPYNPIQVYQDGDIYICVDGNRRLKAMKQNNTRECWAIVRDRDEAEAIAIQIVTGTTAKNLDKVEASRGYQTALDLHVPYSKVAACARTTEENVSKFQTVAKRVGEYAEDASFDRLFFIASNNLTEEQEHEILTARETEWRGVVKSWNKKELEECPLCGSTKGEINWSLWMSLRGR